MHISELLRPITRIALRLFLPVVIMLASGCQMARSTHSTAMSRYDAEFALRMDIVQQAAQHIGSRYKYTGTSPSTGFDCSGFTSYVLGQFEIALPHQSGAQAKVGQAIPVAKVMPGDLVYFTRGNRIFHVALVESNSEDGVVVIHSTTSRGVIRENITRSDYWRPKIAGARTVIDQTSLVQR